MYVRMSLLALVLGAEGLPLEGQAPIIEELVAWYHFQKKGSTTKLSKNQVPLTVCPLSNIKLKVFDKLSDHNLKKMLDKKLMVTINSDDPAYFGGYLNQNLIETQAALNLSFEDIKTLLINSFKSSFLSEEKKQEFILKI